VFTYQPVRQTTFAKKITPCTKKKIVNSSDHNTTLTPQFFNTRYIYSYQSYVQTISSQICSQVCFRSLKRTRQRCSNPSDNVHHHREVGVCAAAVTAATTKQKKRAKLQTLREKVIDAETKLAERKRQAQETADELEAHDAAKVKEFVDAMYLWQRMVMRSSL
jgi:hypothetical protein